MKDFRNKPRLIKKDEIKENLKKIADLVIDEDQENRASGAVGECMEYFLKHHIFETLIAYAKSDKPPGFFNFSMNIIIEILENVECISLISQKSVHPAINQILQMFEVTVKDHQDFKYYSIKVIVDFLLVLSLKVAQKPYLANLLFTNTKRISHRKSDKGDYMPVKVIMRLLQNMTAKDSDEYSNKIYDTLKCILKMNNKLVDDYINNEGELCEVLVNTLERFYRGLPTALIMSPESPFVVNDLIKESFPESMDKHGFYFSYKKFIEYVKFFDECVYLTNNKEIVGNISKIFFNDFLLHLQNDVIDDEKYLIKFRTTIQYLIEIVEIIRHPTIYEMVFYFLFGYKEQEQYDEDEMVSKVGLSNLGTSRRKTSGWRATQCIKW